MEWFFFHCFPGELNNGFSDSTTSSSESVSEASHISIDGSYMVPKSGPKIRVVKPSVRRPHSSGVPASELARRLLSIQSHRSGSFRRHSDIGVRNASQEENEHDLFDRSFGDTGQFWDGNEEFSNSNFHKLMFEGPTHNNRRHSCDSMTLYEKLQRSKLEENTYRPLQKVSLVLPRAVQGACVSHHHDLACTPVTSRSKVMSTTSKQSDHTYDSITADLAGEMNRCDLLDSSVNDLSRSDNESLSCQETARAQSFNISANRGSYSEQQNDLDSSTHHTYESIPSISSETRNIKPNDSLDNAAVIIGRRVSNPFDNRYSNRAINKKKQNIPINGHAKHSKDIDDRYSPFPSVKKLAFKSAFKQVNSPRFALLPSVSKNVNLSFIPTLDFDNLDIRTPEIKVDNQVHFVNDTEFVSPAAFCNFADHRSCNVETELPMNIITPEIAFQTLRACENLKREQVGEKLQNEAYQKSRLYKKSLASVSDGFQEDIVNHCHMNRYAMSTPCEPQQTCNYF